MCNRLAGGQARMIDFTQANNRLEGFHMGGVQFCLIVPLGEGPSIGGPGVGGGPVYPGHPWLPGHIGGPVDPGWGGGPPLHPGGGPVYPPTYPGGGPITPPLYPSGGPVPPTIWPNPLLPLDPDKLPPEMQGKGVLIAWVPGAGYKFTIVPLTPTKPVEPIEPAPTPTA